VDGLELLEAAAGTDGHAGEWAFRQVDGHVGLVTETLVEVREQGATPGGVPVRNVAYPVIRQAYRVYPVSSDRFG